MHHLTKPPKADKDLDEKELTLLLIGTKTNPGIARITGWKAYHTLRSKGSEPGWPDWHLVRERIILIETKTEKGKVSDAQKQWVRALLTAGAETYIVRPKHLQLASRILNLRKGHPELTALQNELLQETTHEIS